MTRVITSTLRAPLGEIWPLLAVGVALASLIGTVQAAGELRYILECAGAVGGPPQRTASN
jgi:hypothetical protein